MLKNSFYICNVDNNQFISCLFIIIDGILRVVDGLVSIVSLGFIGSDFANEWTFWRLKYEMTKNNSKANLR